MLVAVHVLACVCTILKLRLRERIAFSASIRMRDETQIHRVKTQTPQTDEANCKPTGRQRMQMCRVFRKPASFHSK